MVPTGPAADWSSDPFEPEIRDGVLYGRGAADMKSGLAAMVTAAEEFTRGAPAAQGHDRLPDHLAMRKVLRVDGTQRVVQTLRERGQRIDWCLVGEPSSERVLGDTVKVGRRGSLSGRLTVHGVQGHIAYPQLAENPVHTLAPALAELTSRVWDQGTRALPADELPGLEPQRGHRRPERHPRGTQGALQPALLPAADPGGPQGHGRGDPAAPQGALHARVVCLRRAVLYGARASYRRRLADAVEVDQRACRPKLTTGGGTSDGRFIAPLGAEVVELGVISESIHKVNECVRVADIDGLHRMYVSVLRNLLLA